MPSCRDKEHGVYQRQHAEIRSISAWRIDLPLGISSPVLTA
jgi:hypothetical protein